MRVLGTHLDLCDPEKFFDAWKKLGDLSDGDCDRVYEETHKDDQPAE
jgi:hypothetical protein